MFKVPKKEENPYLASDDDRKVVTEFVFPKLGRWIMGCQHNDNLYGLGGIPMVVVMAVAALII